MAAEPSYTSGISSTPLLGDTIGANLGRTAARFGERDALVEHATGRRWTYRQLADEVDAVALGLLDLGVVKGLPFRRLKSDGSAPGSTTITWRFKEPMCT